MGMGAEGCRETIGEVGTSHHPTNMDITLDGGEITVIKALGIGGSEVDGETLPANANNHA